MVTLCIVIQSYVVSWFHKIATIVAQRQSLANI